MERYILNLGLYYQIALMPESIIDAALIHGLVERWHLETHSFHLPVREMTITLQDDSALWGLRIDGIPIVGGVSDNPDYLGLIEDLLGMLPEELQKKRTKNEEESKYEYHLSLAVTL